MTVFDEGNLRIVIDGALSARKFDGADHKLSHCMKAVDFIIELPDKYLFVEFKDPQYPGATAQTISDYIDGFKSGRLDRQFQYKYRDSFLYEWASGRADKPVDYLMLIAIDTLTKPLLQSRMDEMKRKLPLRPPGNQPWPCPFVHSCSVFNIQSWNERFFPKFQISRLP